MSKMDRLKKIARAILPLEKEEGRENCPSITEMANFNAGGLSEQEAKKISDHIRGCKFCQKERADFEAATKGIDTP